MKLEDIRSGKILQVANKEEEKFELYWVSDVYIDKHNKYVFGCLKVMYDKVYGARKCKDYKMIHEDDVVGICQPIIKAKKQY